MALVGVELETLLSEADALRSAPVCQKQYSTGTVLSVITLYLQT